MVVERGSFNFSQVSENKEMLTCLGRWDEASLSEDTGFTSATLPPMSLSDSDLHRTHSSPGWDPGLTQAGCGPLDLFCWIPVSKAALDLWERHARCLLPCLLRRARYKPPQGGCQTPEPESRGALRGREGNGFAFSSFPFHIPTPSTLLALSRETEEKMDLLLPTHFKRKRFFYLLW